MILELIMQHSKRERVKESLFQAVLLSSKGEIWHVMNFWQFSFLEPCNMFHMHKKIDFRWANRRCGIDGMRNVPNLGDKWQGLVRLLH